MARASRGSPDARARDATRGFRKRAQRRGVSQDGFLRRRQGPSSAVRLCDDVGDGRERRSLRVHHRYQAALPEQVAPPAPRGAEGVQPQHVLKPGARAPPPPRRAGRRVFSRRNLGLAEQPQPLHSATPPPGDASPASRATAQTKSSPAETDAHGPSHAPPTGTLGRNRPQHRAARAHAVGAAGRSPSPSAADPAAHHLGRRTELAVVVAAPAQQRAGIGHAAAVASPLDAATARYPVMGVPAASEAVGTSICPRAFSPSRARLARVDGTRVRRARGERGGVRARERCRNHEQARQPRGEPRAHRGTAACVPMSART